MQREIATRRSTSPSRPARTILRKERAGAGVGLHMARQLSSATAASCGRTRSPSGGTRVSFCDPRAMRATRASTAPPVEGPHRRGLGPDAADPRDPLIRALREVATRAVRRSACHSSVARPAVKSRSAIGICSSTMMGFPSRATSSASSGCDVPGTERRVPHDEQVGRPHQSRDTPRRPSRRSPRRPARSPARGPVARRDLRVRVRPMEHSDGHVEPRSASRRRSGAARPAPPTTCAIPPPASGANGAGRTEADRGTPGRRLGHDLRIDPVHRPEQLRVRTVVGGPSVTTDPRCSDHEPIAEGGREVEVVEHRQDGRPPCSASLRTIASRSTTWRMSRWVVGSSSMQHGASWARACARITRRRSPPESSSTGRSARCCTRVAAMASRAADQSCGPPPPQARAVRDCGPSAPSPAPRTRTPVRRPAGRPRRAEPASRAGIA